jgi:hypothetical protein
MRPPIPFKPKALHHAYIAIFSAIAYTISLKYPLIGYIICLYTFIDDIVEHTITADTPLRIMFERLGVC